MNESVQLPCLAPDPDSPFPPVETALRSPNGLLAWGGDLHPRRLLHAYRAGIFPWYGEGQPILWWSPAPRCVLFPEKVYLSRRTRRRFNSGRYRLSADSAFDRVIAACTEPRKDEDGTWITTDMQDAYQELFALGHAHSVEVWNGERLAGGIYGVAIGSLFFGESMFSHDTDGSKIALVALCRLLATWGFGLLDCQVGNPHLYRMGAADLSRPDFERLRDHLVNRENRTGSWQSIAQFEQRWP